MLQEDQRKKLLKRLEVHMKQQIKHSESNYETSVIQFSIQMIAIRYARCSLETNLITANFVSKLCHASLNESVETATFLLMQNSSIVGNK